MTKYVPQSRPFAVLQLHAEASADPPRGNFGYLLHERDNSGTLAAGCSTSHLSNPFLP